MPKLIQGNKLLASLLFIIAGLPFAVQADISGMVLNNNTFMGIEGAVVRVQADPGGPTTVTAADGSFTLAVNPPGSIVISANVVYDSTAAENYPIEQTSASNGDNGVLILLQPLPPDNPTYQPPQPEFSCEVCHQEQVAQWQQSNHAEAATNVWVRDLFSGDGTPDGDNGFVFIDTHDPGETGFCATCHTPLADVFDPGNVMLNEVAQPGALAGVQCLACHQIDQVNENVSGLAHLGNSSYRFPDEAPTELFVWGPLPDVGFASMNAMQAPIFAESRFCASCHEYNNPFTGAPGQSTYTEWTNSPFAVPGPDFATCQNCHMPDADAPGPISNIGGQPIRPPEQRHNHEFIGTTAQMLADNLNLDLTAEQINDELVVTASITNMAGHNFPTGVSIRNALLHITAESNGNALTQTTGSTIFEFANDDVPGIQEGDLAGQPGKGFARVTQGQINNQGPVISPVLFIDAESVLLDTRIPSGATDVTEVRFDLNTVPENSTVVVNADLRWRRAWRALAVTKNWTVSAHDDGPIEILAANQQLSLIAGSGPIIPNAVAVPALGSWAVILLFTLMLVLTTVYQTDRRS